MKFIILTYFTEGFPHDGGNNHVAVEQRFRRSAEGHADKYISFTPRQLMGMNPEYEKYCIDYSSWLEKHPDREQLGHHNDTWARIGFFMWKPILIWNVLNSDEVKPGDIVLYHDVDCDKYPQYILNCEEWRDLSSNILDDLKCDIFIPYGLPLLLKHDVKAYLVRKYLSERYFEKAGLWAGLIVMRKSEMLLQFLSEWVEMSAQLDNISPLPNPNPHPRFIWHSVDQSVAGVLAWIWRSDGRLPMSWPRYAVMGRHFSKLTVKRVNHPAVARIWMLILGRVRRLTNRTKDE